MTGFGQGKTQSDSSVIEVSLRSVNGRYFEPRFHLPKEFIQFESEVKKLLQGYFSRGTVDVFIGRKPRPNVSNQQVCVNLEMTKKYLSVYKDIAKAIKVKPIFHVENFARLPDIITVEAHAEPGGDEKKALLATVKKACESCQKERLREGKSLRSDLEQILDSLEKQVKYIESVREEANQGLADKFEQRIRARLQAQNIENVDSTRLSQEIVIQIEKSDINEEVTRLKEHIKNYRHLFSANEPIGKKLDFYTQELLREVNTIGSKSNLSRLTEIVVESKTLIERLREQVQNIE